MSDKFHINSQTGFSRVGASRGVYPIGSFNPNSIDGLLFQSYALSVNEFLSKIGTNNREPEPRHSLNFNGTTQYVSIPDNADLDITTNLSIVAWIKNDKASVITQEWAFGKYEPTGDQREWLIGFDTDSKLRIQLSSDGTTVAIWKATNTMTLNTVNTIAFTFVGGSALKVYVNGAEVAGSFTSGSLPASLLNGTGNLTIASAGTGAQPFDGNVYEARVYDTAVLTDAEMLAIHNNPTGHATVGANLVAQYKLDEKSGSIAYDSSGNGNNGTLINTPTWETSSEAHSWHNQVGYSVSGAVLVPRDESDTANDVLGSALDYSGIVAFNAKLESSSCISTNGTTQYGTVGDVSNLDKFEGYVKLDADNQVLFSLANSTATAVSVSAGVLTAGGSITLGTIQIGDSPSTVATVTASSAGATLNDNSWHYLVVNFTSFDATNLRYGTNGTNFGNIDLAGWKFSLSGTNVVNTPIAEGVGSTSYDISGNGNNITWVNAPTWTTQNSYHYNLTNGHNKYMFFDGDGSDDCVSFGNILNSVFTGSDKKFSFETNIVINDLTNTFTILAKLGDTSHGTNNRQFSFRVLSTGELDFLYYDTLTVTNARSVKGSTILTTGRKYKIKLEYDGSIDTGNGLDRVKFYVDDVRETETLNVVVGTFPFDIDAGTAHLTVGGTFDNSVVAYEADGSIFDFKIWDNETSTGTPMLSVLGYGNTNADWTDQIGSNNGTVVGSPANIRIPKLTSASTDVLGETLRNPAVVGHNDAETTIDFRNIAVGGTVPPEFKNIANSTDFTAFTFDTDTGWDSYDYAFYRQFSTVVNDRFLLYANNLTGDGLVNALAYVGMFFGFIFNLTMNSGLISLI